MKTYHIFTKDHFSLRSYFKNAIKFHFLLKSFLLFKNDNL